MKNANNRLLSSLIFLSLLIIIPSPRIGGMRLDDDQFRETWKLEPKGKHFLLLEMIRIGNHTALEKELAKDPSLVRTRITRSGFEGEYNKGKTQSPTLLHYAAQSNHPSIVTLLLNYHAQINALSIYGSVIQTPLDWAKKESIREILRERHAKKYAELIITSRRK